MRLLPGKNKKCVITPFAEACNLTGFLVIFINYRLSFFIELLAFFLSIHLVLRQLADRNDDCSFTIHHSLASAAPRNDDAHSLLTNLSAR